MPDNLMSFLHVILLLIMALVTFLVRMSSKDMQARIDALEILLKKFTDDIEDETPATKPPNL